MAPKQVMRQFSFAIQNVGVPAAAVDYKYIIGSAFPISVEYVGNPLMHETWHCQKRFMKSRRVRDRSKKKKEAAFEKVMERQRPLTRVLTLMEILKHERQQVMTLTRLARYRSQLSITRDDRIPLFLGRYPKIFELYTDRRGVTWCGFTEETERLLEEEMRLKEEYESTAVNYIRRFLMMSVDKTLPIAKLAHFKREFADLLQRSPPVSAIIADAILTPTFHIAAKFKLPIYILFPASAFTLGLMVYAPVLEAQGFDFSDEKAVLQIPGFPPLPTTQIAQALRIKDHIFRRIFLSSGSEVAKTSGILVNTFEELEEDCLQALRSGQAARDLQLPPVYAVGPLFWSSNLSTSDDETQKQCLTWLDAQPAKSVVYVSFGSRSAMSAAQVSELALGLESSQQRFLWVLRTSVVDGASSDPAVLPPGFESRVQDRCLVVSSWVPQVKILSHVSTGAFVSHCGWNSVVEGVCCGVPMVAWPLFGDQMMNARIVAENAKVGVQIRKDENGIVTKEEVESVVRSVMKGEEFRSAATKMGKLGRIAVSEGGSSDKSLKQALHNWNE